MAKQETPQTRSILDLSLEEAEKPFAEMGEPEYRAAQVFLWVYHKHVVQWGDMSNLPLSLRDRLASDWRIMTSHVEEVRTSEDGTVKLLVRLADGHAVESVFIPDDGRSSVCLSTQVGCPIRCTFCASGKGGLKRNLSSGEILEQILHIFSALPAGAPIRNVVLMGMGEPMLNYDNVMRAVRAMNAEWGFEIGARRITISTIGVVKGIERLAKEGLQVNLAISLHGPDDVTRGKIVPAKKAARVGSLVEAARSYFAETRRRVGFEYVLIEGLNSSLQHARELGRVLRGFPCFVNLIPFNRVEHTTLRPPDRRRAHAFLSELERSGIPAAIRTARGDDISAACGQLAGEKEAPKVGSVPDKAKPRPPRTAHSSPRPSQPPRGRRPRRP
jgi:23S rRNA (adenine2503-C2)-methyltransferase